MSDPNEYDEDSEQSLDPAPTLWERLGDAARASAAAVAGGAAAAATGVRDGAEAVRDGWHKGSQRADKWAANGAVRSRWLFVMAAGTASVAVNRQQSRRGGRQVCLPCITVRAPLALQVGRAFQFKQRNAKFSTELRAGLITFLMASGRRGRSLRPPSAAKAALLQMCPPTAGSSPIWALISGIRGCHESQLSLLAGLLPAPAVADKHTALLHSGPPLPPCLPLVQVSYILAVNPTILATTGGTCDPQTVCGVNPAVCCGWRGQCCGLACLLGLLVPCLVTLAPSCLLSLACSCAHAT